MSKNGNTSPLFKILTFKNIWIYSRLIFFFCTVQIKDSCIVDIENRRFYLPFLRLIWDFAPDRLQQKMLYLERKKYNSFALKNIKIVIPTPPSFSAGAYFWCFKLQQLVLKICNNYFKFGATLFNLKQLYFICSNVFFLICSNFTVICSNFLICSMSLVGNRTEKTAMFNSIFSELTCL